MANIYKDISAFTKKAAASGNEEFQVSATEKITAAQIAALVTTVSKSSTMTVTDFKNIATNFSNLNVGEAAFFTASSSAAFPPKTGATSVGYAVKTSSTMVTYIAAAVGGTASTVGYEVYGGASNNGQINWRLIADPSEGSEKLINAYDATGDMTELGFDLSGSTGDLLPFKFNAGTTGAPTTNSGIGFLQPGTSTTAAIVYEDIYNANGGKIWYGVFNNTSGGFAWKELGGGSTISPMEISDFTMINELWPTSLNPGTMVPFYTGSEIYSGPIDSVNTAYTGFVILDSNFSTSGIALIMAYGNVNGRQYIGSIDFQGQSLNSWYPISMPDVKQVSSFTSLINDQDVVALKAGGIIPFFSSNGGGSTGPGANPILGLIQKASSGQVNIYAQNIQGTNFWIGYATSSTTKWTPLGGDTANVLYGENITEGLEYLLPENVGDVVAFRITGDSSQVPNTTEGFGLLGKINGSESLLIATQINPNNTYEELLFTGRVQNDGSGTDWHQVGASSSGGMVQLWSGELPLSNGAPEMINFIGGLSTGDTLMMVYDYSGFIGDGGVLTGQEYGRSLISEVADRDVELAQSFYTMKTVGSNLQHGFFTLKMNFYPSAISIEAIGDDDNVINPFRVKRLYRLPKQ